jgi:MoxR-like ATPase
MTFQLNPGNALAIRINAHRSGWDGTICENPTSWSCLADPKFQEKYCARGLRDCFHIDTFSHQEPKVVIEENGGAWIFEKIPTAFDDQILLFWTQDFEEPHGVRQGGSTEKIAVGAYRVKDVYADRTRSRAHYLVRPHPGGWTRFHRFAVPTPFMRSVGGPYVKQLDRKQVIRLFDTLREEADSNEKAWFSPEDQKRFDHFDTQLDNWLEEAADAAAERAAEQARMDQSRIVFETDVRNGPAPGALSSITRVVDSSKLPSGEPEVSEAAPAPSTAAKPAPSAKSVQLPASLRPPLVEEPNRAWIRETHGRENLHALMLGSQTKQLIVLRGAPGVGKSHLALRLLDDPKRERTLRVPVSATWRGPEDLLGYVNPVDHRFEATSFTQFLIDAEKAWETKKDRRARLVIFEEFNLSSPEHWFSELMVTLEAEDPTDRVWRIPGQGLRNLPNKHELMLSPALHFVATINTDHTVHPLSPRLLDRAAVITLELEPRKALSQVGLELEEDQVLALLDLDDTLRAKGISFSIRSAISLARAMNSREELGLDTWAVLDLVLRQEILGRVRLHARDPFDEEVRKQLARWNTDHAKSLPLCSDLLQSWDELLSTGCDIIQA